MKAMTAVSQSVLPLVTQSAASLVVVVLLHLPQSRCKTTALPLKEPVLSRTTGDQRAAKAMLSHSPNAWTRTAEICRSVDGIWNNWFVDAVPGRGNFE